MNLVISTYRLDSKMPFSGKYMMKSMFSRAVYGKTDMAFSFLMGRFVKNCYFYHQHLYLMEIKPVEGFINQQNLRLDDLARRARNVRDLEDNELKKMKLHFMYFKQKTRHIRKSKRDSHKGSHVSEENDEDEEIVCVGEAEEEFESPATSKTPTSPYKGSGTWQEMGKKAFLRKQTQLLQADKIIEEFERGIRNFWAENQIIEEREDESEILQEKPLPIRHSTSKYTSKNSHFFSLKHSISLNSGDPAAQFSQLFMLIKSKKNLIYFYDMFDKIITELLSAENLLQLGKINWEKKMKDMTKVLKENKIPRLYLLDILEQETRLRKELFEASEATQAKYKNVSGSLVQEKQAALRTTQSLAAARDTPINPLKQKEFSQLVASLAKKKRMLRECMGQVTEMISEYLEMKESMYGVKIGDEQMIFQYFVNETLKNGEAIQELSEISSRIEEAEEWEDSFGSSGSHEEDPKSEQISFEESQEPFKRYNSEVFDKSETTEASIQNLTSCTAATEQSKEVLNRYKRIKLLSKSPSATVWLVEEKQSKLQFALKKSKQVEFTEVSKIFAAETRNDGLALNDFVIRTCLELKHGSFFYRVMEFAPHQSLRRFFEEETELITKKTIKKILACLFLCIVAIHRHKCVSLRLNPDHILIDRTGKPKLLSKGVELFGRLL